jgi:putative DNA primase/helicase
MLDPGESLSLLVFEVSMSENERLSAVAAESRPGGVPAPAPTVADPSPSVEPEEPTGQGQGEAPGDPWEASGAASFTERRPIAAPGSKPLRFFNHTDSGNAERLASLHHDKLMYCRPWKSWLAWDGKRWKRDETGEAERLALNTLAIARLEADSFTDSTAADRFRKFLSQSESDHGIRAMLNRAQVHRHLYVEPSELDTDPWLLNLQNGTLDLRTGELLPQNPADGITKLAPVGWYDDANCPRFMDFLKHVMNGSDAMTAYLQRAVGYTLTGDTSEQCLFIPYGVGANGKSTFLNIIRKMLGPDYSQQVKRDELMVKRSGGINEGTASLFGIRFAMAVETAEGQRLDEPLIKQITGGDPVRAAFKYQNSFEYLPEYKIWLATNHKPQVRGTDEGIWRRIRLVPFTVVIPKHNRDKRLDVRLCTELAGILRWAVEGCLAWRREGLGEPPEVEQATSAYRQEEDELGRFLRECFAFDPGGTARAHEIFDAYRRWSGSTITQRTFGSNFREYIEREHADTITSSRDGQGNFYRGLHSR